MVIGRLLVELTLVKWHQRLIVYPEAKLSVKEIDVFKINGDDDDEIMNVVVVVVVVKDTIFGWALRKLPLPILPMCKTLIILL